MTRTAIRTGSGEVFKFDFPSVWSESAFVDLRSEILKSDIGVCIWHMSPSDGNYVMEHIRDLYARYASSWSTPAAFVQNYVNSVITETEVDPVGDHESARMWSIWALKLKMFAIGA